MSDVMAANPQHYSMGGFSYGTLCNATASPVPPSQMGVCELFNQPSLSWQASLLRTASPTLSVYHVPSTFTRTIRPIQAEGFPQRISTSHHISDGQAALFLPLFPSYSGVTSTTAISGGLLNLGRAFGSELSPRVIIISLSPS